LNSKREVAIAEVKSAEDEHLGPFLAATGLKDVQAYEQATRESREEFNKNRRALTEHISQLEEQKNYESNRDLKKPIKTLENRLKSHNKKLKAAREREEKLKSEGEVVKGAFHEAEAAHEEALGKEAECEEKVKALQKEFKEAQQERIQVSKAVSTEESALEQLRGKLHETLQKARVEEVELPMIGAQNDGNSSDEEIDGEDPQETSQPTQTTLPSGTQFSQEYHPKMVADRNDAAKIDFSGLRSDLKQRLSDREERTVRKDFDEKRMKLEAELEGIAPNMKAQDALSAITEKLKGTDADFQQAKEKSRKAAAEFQKIKNQRTKRFMEAFTHIDKSLKTIYTDMTKSSKHPLGGNAYLSLDREDEPFLGGMKFNAMPPMKRFRDMYQLSGGEKTVASLALLFAIHSYQPAPFFVMDEVDAALDNINLRKVCNYIQRRSQTDFQCIVISLKDMFYERSDSLVGICKDVGTNSSRTLTLDLTQYDKKRALAEEKAKGNRKRKERATQSEGGEPRKRAALPASPATTVATQ